MGKAEQDLARYQADKEGWNRRRSVNMRAQRFRLTCQVKQGSCVDCGRAFPPWALEFDHRDPASKVCNISTLIAKGRMTEELQCELLKCDLVCGVCHVYRTRKRVDRVTAEDEEFMRTWWGLRGTFYPQPR